MGIFNAPDAPEGFPEHNPSHFNRTVEVIIIKKIQNFIEPGTDVVKDNDTFTREYAEFLGAKSVLKNVPELDDSWKDPNTGIPLYKHYKIVALNEPTLLQNLKLDSSSVAKGNLDIFQINVSNSIEDRGRCTISINSREGKYLFQKNPFRLGDSVFDSNEEIFVNMSDPNGVLRRVFTGYVSGVHIDISTSDTLLTTITLDCEDMLKQLSQSRTCYKPSASAISSAGEKLTGFSPNFSGQLPHKILTNILGRAYCNLWTATGYKDKITWLRDDMGTSQQEMSEEAENEDAIVSGLLDLPTTQVNGFGKNDSTFILTKSDGNFAALSADAHSIQQSVVQQKSTAIPKKIYGFKKTKSNPSVSLIDRAMGPYGYDGQQDADNLAFIISGTKQPAYVLSTSGSPDYFFADWKSGLAVCNEIAQNLNYELFADEMGVVIFRPMNAHLPHDLDPKLSKSSKNLTRYPDGRVGFEYWLDQKLIKSQLYTDTDNGIFTIARVSGTSATGADIATRGVAVDLLRFLQLGPRYAPIVQKINLGTNEACQAYAWGLLSRLNGNASTATIAYSGDPRLQIGNPCYIPHRNSIYYITSITHTFTVGESYTTTLELKYGRRPIAATSASTAIGADTTTMNILTHRQFSDAISDLDKQDAATDTLMGTAILKGADSQTKPLAAKLSQYIVKNKPNLTFQGYLWEIVYPLDYESLTDIIQDQVYRGSNKEVHEAIKQDNVQAKKKKIKLAQSKLNKSASSLIKASSNRTLSDVMDLVHALQVDLSTPSGPQQELGR